jgi:hypothetical protein
MMIFSWETAAASHDAAAVARLLYLTLMAA